ncbi:MAG: isoprenylcysteine carboxylmethyltransferase family protein [Deltaproteobacteria bacterium]|jgi:protein-S-isoprenylcysteine O-methyltransferase Ste14|nr:isoprenylcysteine carboxylmethyltransferase family protein [Deltaproteobacteria bacterium]MBW2530224.1 isoprenylcysteine carboxylmethyltransferase family protein [Deltaproteobacteria bacterium]
MPTKAALKKSVLIRIPLYAVFMAAVLFGTAGRLDWWMGWAYVLLMLIVMIPTALTMAEEMPDLMVERMSRKKDVKRWDRVFVPLVAGIGPLATWIVAGLDVRFGWTGELPWLLATGGLAVALIGQMMTVRAMKENRFFSAFVRIQRDRGHRVVDTGPYARVRHPGYTGAILFCVGLPAMLESLWAFVPSLITAGLLVARTALEDQTLRRELEGYATYAGRVRYRLVPGIW